MEVVSLGQEMLSHMLRGNMPPADLTSLFVSKGLGIGILAGACVTKLPQVWAVAAARSADGLSLTSTELENYVYLVHAAYGTVRGLPFTAYGESVVVWAQNLALLACMYRFKRAGFARPLLTLCIIAGIVAAVVSGVLDVPAVTRLYDMNSLVFMAARLPQIITAFKEGRTGQLSLFTSFLQFAGGAVRIFTSLKEQAGAAMVRGFVLGSLLNGTVVAQILYYGKDGRDAAVKKKSQ